MSINTFDAFGPLDDLIQVIYQASHRFVLLSRVDFDSHIPGWNVYIGLADQGRWWKGRWEEKDVDALVGKNVSSQLLEAFADNVAKAMTQGELYVGGMGADPGPEMKIIFDPNGTKPLSIPLTELSQLEATVFLTNEFFELGLNAQKRKCKLNPPAFPTFTSAPVASHEQRQRYSPPPTKRKALDSPPSPPVSNPSNAKSGRRRSPIPARKTDTEKPPEPPVAVQQKPKAGPAKRARKVQKMEFASDDE